MGNLCSKTPSKADNDPFAQPGRVLGSTPSKPSQPRSQIPKTTTGGQKLGTTPTNTFPSSSSSQQAGSLGGNTNPSDPRAAAAKAAEERFARNQGGGGKLGKELEKQRGMTRNDTLKEISETERRVREVDQGSKMRNYD